MLPSSVPLRLTVNAGAFCSTVVIGFAGAVMVGGLLMALTAMLAVLVVAGVLTLSDSEAVKLAVPLKPLCSVTWYVTVAVPCPATTVTPVMPVPDVADQL